MNLFNFQSSLLNFNFQALFLIYLFFQRFLLLNFDFQGAFLVLLNLFNFRFSNAISNF